MKRYIRVVNNAIAEIIEVADNAKLEQLYHPDVVKQFQLATGDVQVGHVLENGAWVAPPPVEPPPIPPTPPAPPAPEGQTQATPQQ